MLTAAVKELVQDVLQKDLDYEFSNIVKRYYDQDVEVLDFPSDRYVKLGVEDSSPSLIDTALREEDQQSF